MRSILGSFGWDLSLTIDRTETYDSDANGNRYPSGAAEVDVDAQDRLMSWGDLEFTFTDHGTLSTRTDTISNETTTHTYAAFGQLRRVDLPDGSSIIHGVDARGPRNSRSADRVVTHRYVYHGSRLVAEVDAGEGELSRYIDATKGHVPDVMEQGGVLYRLVREHLGSRGKQHEFICRETD